MFQRVTANRARKIYTPYNDIHPKKGTIMTKDKLAAKATGLKAKITRKRVILTTAVVAGLAAVTIAVLNKNASDEIETLDPLPELEV